MCASGVLKVLYKGRPIKNFQNVSMYSELHENRAIGHSAIGLNSRNLRHIFFVARQVVRGI